MVIMNYAAVAAYGYVYACFLKIFVSFLANLDKRGSLSSAYALLLSCDTDRAAADAYLDKVRAALRKETEALLAYNVARAYLNGIAVMLSYPSDSRSG